VVLAACNLSLPPESALRANDAGLDGGDAELADGGASDASTDAGETDGGRVATIDAGPVEPDAGIIVVSTDAGEPRDAGVVVIDAGVGLPVGGGCSSNADCAGGTCDTQAPGGYCTQTCGNGGACPSGSTCAFLLGNYCVQSCGFSADCRSGYSCQGGTCLASYCQSSFQCAQGQTCDMTQGVCVNVCRTNMDCQQGQACQNGTCVAAMASGCSANSDCPTGETCTNHGVCSGGSSRGPAAGQIGASCSGNGFGGGGASCQQGPQPECLGANRNFSGGYCSSSCQQGADCGSGNVCAHLLDQNGNAQPLCLESCSADSDCRPQYNCVTYGGQSFCLNQCQSNADCPDPTTQTCNTVTGLCSP
jgi:Cys-rich repeat protein